MKATVIRGNWIVRKNSWYRNCKDSRSEKILKSLSSLIENGILTSKDIKKEISTDLKFKRDKIINKLELVSRDEFEVLKKIVQKQEAIIQKLSKNKKIKKAKKP